MLLSIIIPTYNSLSYLPAAIDSISKQGFTNYELLIMDNNSTDGSKDYIDQIQKQDNRIKFISGSDNGIYDAMNKGIALAGGQWLYFMGADDRLAAPGVLQQLQPFLQQEWDMVYGDCTWMPEGRPEQGEWSYEQFIKVNINHQRIFYKKKLFETYGGYHTQYKIAADHELNIRFFCNNHIQKKYVPICISLYHAGGFSANKFDNAFWENWDAIILKNFKPHLSAKKIYGSLGTYIRHLADEGKTMQALKLIGKNFIHTGSPGFIKLMLSYILFSKKEYAG